MVSLTLIHNYAKGFTMQLVQKTCQGVHTEHSQYLDNTVGSRLSERIGTEGCSDNRNVQIIEVLTNSIDNTCLKNINNVFNASFNSVNASRSNN